MYLLTMLNQKIFDEYKYEFDNHKNLEIGNLEGIIIS